MIREEAADPMADKTPFTPGMKDVMRFARAEAGRLNHDHIGPEHYLLGMIRKGDGLAVQVLTELEIDLDALKAAVEETVGLGQGAPPLGIYDPTPEARHAIDAAKEISKELGQAWFGTEHLLLALIRLKGSALAKLFSDFEIDFERTKKQTLRVIERGGEPGPATVQPQTVGKVHAATEGGLASRGSGANRTPFTPGMKDVMRFARAEAGRLNHDYVGPEHYLLGIIRKGDGLAIQVLTDLGVDLDSLKRAVERAVGIGQGPISLGVLNATTEAKQVIGGTKWIAREMQHAWIGTEHLLLSLIRSETKALTKTLHDFGIGYEEVLQRVLWVIEGRD